ncbi:MAG: hypothetical protein V3S98_11055 [Dehalococcoidia bacterium]
MTDTGTQMYRIAAVTGLGLNAFNSDEWKVLLEIAGLERSSDVVSPSEWARAAILLEACDGLGIRSEGEVVLSELAAFIRPAKRGDA